MTVSSRSTLIGRALETLDDVKVVATQLNNALEEAGVSLPRAQLLQVIARLCGAHRFDELQHRFRSKSGSAPSISAVVRAELRLLTLPEVLLLKRPEGDDRLAGHLEFADKNSGTRWCYAMSSAALKPAALEAARRLALGEPLRPLDSKWLTGRSRDVSVIDDDRADGVLHIDARSLAGAGYLGDGRWSVGPDYYCRVSVYDPLSLERLGVPLGSNEMADAALAARCFSPPPDFLAAGFEVFTANIPSRLTLRCLGLASPGPVLESLWLLGRRWPETRIRAALLRMNKDGTFQLICVSGNSTQLLSGLGWAATHGANHGSSRQEYDYSGEPGLALIWQEIRAWVAHPAGGPAETAASLPPDRRAALQKWVEGGREWEHSPQPSESS